MKGNDGLERKKVGRENMVVFVCGLGLAGLRHRVADTISLLAAIVT